MSIEMAFALGMAFGVILTLISFVLSMYWSNK